MNAEAYLFGQVLGTHSFLLQGEFLKPGEYAEIDAQYFLPGGEMLYGRKGEAMKRMKPFPVEVRSTLGAGDIFQAGCVYALLHAMSDAA